jgi:phosphoribosylanthranilate isomerase
MAVQAKICGLNTAESVAAALDHGAAWIGLMFFAPSPRFVSLEQAAALSAQAAGRAGRVGVFVVPDDAMLAQTLAAVALDVIQLHGKEPPERVAEVKARFGLPVWKAVSIAEPADVENARQYFTKADRLLFDAKPPKGSVLPGGNAVSFDWTLLTGTEWPLPWLLSGGLRAGNVAEAVRLTGASAVDVSSGVESAPGHKDAARIRAFLDAVTAIDG